MADSIREQIIASIQTTLETIVTPAYLTNVIDVQRVKTTVAEADMLPAIYIFEGPDTLLTQESRGDDSAYDRLMTIVCECWLEAVSDLSKEVEKFRQDVVTAMMADRNQGLPNSVIDTQQTDTDFTVIIDEAGNARGGVQVTFEISYRVLASDPTAS